MPLLLAEAAHFDLPGCVNNASWFCKTYDDLQGLNPSHLVFMMIPFWITVIVVSRLAVKPLLHVFEEREKRTSGARAEAAEFETKFNDRLKTYEARIAESRQKASDERAKIRASAAQEVDKVLTAAREDAAKAVDQVRSAIDAERTKARSELTKQAETLAAELAGKALGRDVGTAGAGGARSGGGAARTGAVS